MIVNHLNKLFVTNDASTMVREMEVAHPAAKLVAMAAQAQTEEIGDATNLVVVLAGTLCEMAEDLLRQGLHTADIIAGSPPPYCCPSPCPYCTLTLSLPSRSTRTRRTTRFTTQSRPGLQPPPPPSYSSTYHSPYCTPFLLLFSLRCVQLHPPGQRAAETCPLSTGGGRDAST